MIRKKLIIDITVLNDCEAKITGIPRVIVEYCKRLLDGDYDITFIAFNYDRKKYYLINTVLFRFFLKTNSIEDFKFVTKKTFDINKIDKNYVFFDIGPVEVAYKRSILYSTLKKNGATILTLVHDVIPLMLNTFEQKENNLFYFLNMYTAIFRYADAIIATTKSESKNINYFLQKCKCSIPIYIVPLGNDFNTNYLKENVSSKIINAAKRKYLLMVGSIAPRKNHILALNSFNDYLFKENVSLIIAGQRGWLTENVLDKIRTNSQYNKSLFFLENPNNDEILYLYKHAFATLMPSLSEGYGIPVVESLKMGCPVFCSDIPVFHEISNNYAVFFDNKSSGSLSEQVLKYLKNEQKYLDLKNKLKSFKSYSWDESYNILIKIIKNL